MDNPITRGGFINFGKLNAKSQAIIDEFGLPIRPETPVQRISVAYQQMVKIMKAYNRKADIICFDEPPAPLTDAEITILFNIICKLKSEGKAIIYVSHRMKEIFELTDRVVVFKHGKLMGVKKTSQTSEPEPIKMMVGLDIGDVFNTLPRNDKVGDVVLELNNVSTEYVRDINLQVCAGEIVGFSGLAGAGRTETARPIFGADLLTAGSMTLEGLSLILTVRENTSQAILGDLCRMGFVNFHKEREPPRSRSRTSTSSPRAWSRRSFWPAGWR